MQITSLLALASVAAAVPHFQHNKFHHRAAYPTGGWGAYNSSAVAAGTGAPTTTIDKTSTSTQTLYSTVYLHGSSSVESVDAAAVPTGLTGSSAGCGPNVVTEKVTVTVTPGAGTPAPKPSAPVVESSSSPAAPATPVAEKSTSAAGYPAVPPAATPVKESPAPSSTPIKTPVAEKSSSAAGYPAQTPVASATSTASATQKPATSSAASSSAAPSPSAGTGNSYSGTKRGLAYNDAELCSTFGSKFGFGYNWGQVESNDIGTAFIPMMHGPDKSSAEEWLANVDKAVKKGSKAVMGFNECDIAAQCNLSPEAACSAWKTYMNPIKSAHPDVTIIGPSVSNGQAPLGLDWLSRFQSACSDASVDAANIHFYDQYDSTVFDRFKSHVEQAAKQTGMKVWITEFGLNPGTASETQAVEFLSQCMEYLDASPVVQGYSWFMVGSGENQLNANGGLSAVGKVYAGAA
ncbi:glycoside hydrolase family [Pyrenophora seminiperda CCB06]|uniref:Glycoside hydrolase family n=1 Tax=Pyrenophora seminiperda CCB06 TaxID=1302712 RepID=A0A3M7MC44_9PLEO|nr:glycoside hydrolase family [Pyrenophora seminiperda CCB06]